MKFRIIEHTDKTHKYYTVQRLHGLWWRNAQNFSRKGIKKFSTLSDAELYIIFLKGTPKDSTRVVKEIEI